MINLTHYSQTDINKLVQKMRATVFNLNNINPNNIKEIDWALKGIIEIGKNTDVKTPLYVDIGNVKVGNHCFIDQNCTFKDIGYIEIGDNVYIEANCTFIANTYPGNPLLISPSVTTPNKITIGKGVLIGANSVIMPGITIGDYAIIVPGSVVNQDIPNREVWGGNPISYLEPLEKYYDKNQYLIPKEIFSK
jgi:acetyltransferase-like isoleucine patch superfamily enzyme